MQGMIGENSSKISTQNLPQYSEFLNNNYPNPPKPNSMWELGFAAGNTMIFGDIKSKADVGGGITLRHALSHTFSIRGGYFGGYSQDIEMVISGWEIRVRTQNWKHHGGS